MQVTVFDRASYKISSRKITDEGFLCVPGRVARTGIQEYLACELGITDCDPMKVIKVMRPEEEVFSQESMDSYIGSDVTIEHPSKFVDATDYSTLSKGPVISVERDGDFVKANLIIKAADAIEAVNSGKVELSAGYTAIYDKAPEDAGYDYIQRNIRINHVAIVDCARGGSRVRLFDNQPNQPEINKMHKVVLDSGRSVELEDGATAALLQDSFERLSKDANDAKADLETIQATADAQGEKIKQLETDLKAATDADSIKSKLAELAQVKDSAINIAGKEFECDSVDSMEIKRAALTVARDSIDWSEKSDEYVTAAFEFADMDMKGKKDKDEDDEDDKKKAEDSKKKLAQDGARFVEQVADSASRRKFMDANRWKVTTGQVSLEELQQQADKIGG